MLKKHGVNADTVKNQPDLVQRFVDASAIGWVNYLHGDRSAAAALMKRDNPEMSDGEMEASVALMKRLVDAFPGTVVGSKDSSGDWNNTRMLIERFPGLVMPRSHAGRRPTRVSRRRLRPHSRRVLARTRRHRDREARPKPDADYSRRDGRQTGCGGAQQQGHQQNHTHGHIAFVPCGLSILQREDEAEAYQ
ncbi:MAG: hypothetical protein HC767_07580 [Akkermansiaceae bacterium]|nr:hypothetical protein [Akkermansiaceae bacterium]